MFELDVCAPTERVRDVAARVKRFDFDNVPVREDGSVKGVVENMKTLDPDSVVARVMRPLSEDMLIAGAVSLVSFLPKIADRPYRLVVGDSGIRGVVTPSDVVQLPVRLLVFALLAHLEELMRAVIRQTEPLDDRAVQKLSAKRRERVKDTLASQKRKGLNPAPLDVTQFIDKANLLFDIPVLAAGKGDRQLFRELYALRNKVDHVDRYAETPDQLRAFLEHLRELEAWIDRLAEFLPPDAPAVAAGRSF